jgi:hypothetical protein
MTLNFMESWYVSARHEYVTADILLIVLVSEFSCCFDSSSRYQKESLRGVSQYTHCLLYRHDLCDLAAHET